MKTDVKFVPNLPSPRATRSKIYRFIMEIQKRPGEWAEYDTERLSRFSRATLPDEFRENIDIRNVKNEAGYYTTYLLWKGTNGQQVDV